MDTKLKILNIQNQKELIQEFRDYYIERISELRTDVNDDYENPHLSQRFQVFFKQAIFNEALDKYTNLNWYWLQLIEKLVHLIYLHEEFTVNEDSYELTETEDELFNFWHDSDYAKSFLEELNESRDLLLVSQKHLGFIEDQIISVFILQISDEINIGKALYYNIPEVGDSHQRIYKANNHIFTNIDEDNDKKFIFNLSNARYLQIEDKDIHFDQTAQKNKHGIFIHSSSKEIDKSLEDFDKRIGNALDIIKESSSELYNTFINFTETIVPINEKGVVSYSMQSLPGHSSINMYERDFLDLLDDLLHENGHHYMNHFLNLTELIIEDDEKIYYSPWRRALRPIRGIYHAYFTFFWAYLLYRSLVEYIENNDTYIYQFSEQEISKVYRRCLEEYYMINFCWQDLTHAKKEGKVTDEGWDLILELHEHFQLETSNISNILTKLESIDKDAHSKIVELVEELEKVQKHYS